MKKIISYITVLLLIPLVAVIGMVTGDRAYTLVIAVMALLSCVPFFLSFERKRITTTELVTLAVLTAISAIGRILFNRITPHFIPITAIVIVCGMYMGSGSGFICGSLSAILSNMSIGQGPWTPFQMIGWGLIGFIGGLIGKKLDKHPVFIALYGVLSAFVFTAVMDIWSTASFTGAFTVEGYIATLALSMPSTLTHAASNLVFLLILGKPLGRVITRVKNKYLY